MGETYTSKIMKKKGEQVAEDKGIYTPTEKIKEEKSTIFNAERDRATAEKLLLDTSEKDRKRRNSMFQTEGGSSGMEVMNVAQRGTIFGN